MDNMKKLLRQRYFADEKLTERERLILLLSYSERGKKAEEIADNILSVYGSIRNAADSDPVLLMRECKAGKQTAALLALIPQLSRKCAILSCGNMLLDSTSAAKRYFSAYMRTGTKEKTVAAAVDKQFRIISTELISEGEPSAVKVSFRRIAEFAFRHEAAYIFAAHIHTSGAATPSDKDISATLSMKEALSAIDIILADHIITAPDRSAVSMREILPAGTFPPVAGYSTTGEQL